jgi:hypothetical protein
MRKNLTAIALGSIGGALILAAGAFCLLVFP